MASALLDLVGWRGLFLLASPAAGLVGLSAHHSGHDVALSVAGAVFFLAVFSIVPDVWRRLNTLWRFTVAESPDGLRLRSGLLSTQAHTVPPGRIQALRITQPAMWRPFGWAAVHMNVAGYVGARQAHNRILLPVAPLPVAQALVEPRARRPAARPGPDRRRAGDPAAAAGLDLPRRSAGAGCWRAATPASSSTATACWRGGSTSCPTSGRRASGWWRDRGSACSGSRRPSRLDARRRAHQGAASRRGRGPRHPRRAGRALPARPAGDHPRRLDHARDPAGPG